MGVLGTDTVSSINQMLNLPVQNALLNRARELENRKAEATLPYAADQARLGNELTGQQVLTAPAQRAGIEAQTGLTGAETAGKTNENALFNLIRPILEQRISGMQGQNPIASLSQSQPSAQTQAPSQPMASQMGPVQPQQNRPSAYGGLFQAQQDALRESQNNDAIGNMGAIGKMVPPSYDKTMALNQLKSQAISEAATELQQAADGTKGAKPDERARALGAVMAKYPLLADDPKISKMVMDLKKTDPLFNPATMDMANNRVISTYISRFDAANKDYEKRVTPFVNLQGLINSPTWGTGAGDISLLNQLSLAEYGGYKPSQAEYEQFAKRMGLGEKIEKVIGSLQSGQALAPEVRDRMVQEIEEVTKKTHANFKKTMEAQRGRITAHGGIDPDEVIAPMGTYQDVEDYFSKKGQSQGSPNTGVEHWERVNGKLVKAGG